MPKAGQTDSIFYKNENGADLEPKTGQTKSPDTSLKKEVSQSQQQLQIAAAISGPPTIENTLSSHEIRNDSKSMQDLR